jgi:hypothetical protein
MYRKRWALAGAAAAALSVLAGLAMAAPAAAAAGWTPVSVPQTGNNTELNAVSARTSTDAWAVGVPASEWAAGINGADQALVLSHG